MLKRENEHIIVRVAIIFIAFLMILVAMNSCKTKSIISKYKIQVFQYKDSTTNNFKTVFILKR